MPPSTLYNLDNISYINLTSTIITDKKMSNTKISIKKIITFFIVSQKAKIHWSQVFGTLRSFMQMTQVFYIYAITKLILL